MDAALSPAHFDAGTSTRTLRIGLADSAEQWLLPALLRALEQEAPHMVLVAIPVQFRNVSTALTARQVDAAVTVADELPAMIKRQTLFTSRSVCLFDPRHARVAKSLSERAYFDHEHVIVSYNGDLRGIVEDALQQQRRVRCSLPSFHNVGTVIDGTAMLATVPDVVARQIRASHPHLRTLPLPFVISGTALGIAVVKLPRRKTTHAAFCAPRW